MRSDVYTMRDPTAEASPSVRPRRNPPQRLDDAVIGLLCISKERSEEFLDTIETDSYSRKN